MLTSTEPEKFQAPPGDVEWECVDANGKLMGKVVKGHTWFEARAIAQGLGYAGVAPYANNRTSEVEVKVEAKPRKSRDIHFDVAITLPHHSDLNVDDMKARILDALGKAKLSAKVSIK